MSPSFLKYTDCPVAYFHVSVSLVDFSDQFSTDAGVTLANSVSVNCRGGEHLTDRSVDRGWQITSKARPSVV